MSSNQTLSQAQPTASDPILKQGDFGAAVFELQTLLNTKGAKLVTDGNFGPATKAAVVKFQQQNGLVADGIVGPKTWVVLRKPVEQPINLVDVCLNYQPDRFPHQTNAINWLEAQLTFRTFREFMQRFDKALIQPDPLLKQGDSGATVRRLQGMLNATGANLVVDSQFGPATRAAVIKFQQQHGLTADGTVGDQTWAKLFQVVEKRPLRVLFQSYQEHQFDYTKAALEWLQAQISSATLTEFATRWRNQ